MEFQDADDSRKKGCCGGFFSDRSSTAVFLKISGIIAIVAILVLVIVLPVYFTVLAPDNDTVVNDTIVNITPDSEKFDCYPEGDATKEDCENRGCSWFESPDVAIPDCYFDGPSSYAISSDTTQNDGGVTSILRRTGDASSHFGEQFQKLTVETTYISATTLRIKIFPEEDRYEVPLEHPVSTNKPSDALFSAEHVMDNGKFGVRVNRTSSEKILFDTSVGELMFSDQFLQISTKVASEYIYGFGEHMHGSFKHDMNWKKYGMFSRDQWVQPVSNLYGVHPYFTCMEGDGNAYGVFFVNSNAMDVTLQPTPAITYRSIGGVLDFYIFLGPSPEQVTEQYTSLIGRPYFPPYWSLGFQLCRYGYGNLENLTRVVDRNLAAGIPYEIQYSDIDYMERQLDFTIDQERYGGLGDFVKNLKDTEKMRYIIILDPAISGNETAGSYPPFDNGVTDDVFIKTPEGNISWGKVWPDYPNVTVNTSESWDEQTRKYRAYSAFPDFFKEETADWWKALTVDFHGKLEFDGLWIDMNEPASFVHGTPDNECPAESKYDFPPYHPSIEGNVIYDKTLCMQSKQYHPATMTQTQHYNVHSLYGLSQSPPTLAACRASTGERCIVISRSTYPGSGKHAGHWLGDNNSDWTHLAASIIGMLEFNLFGIPYIGADVCGFFSDASHELCLRWMQLGAFYPFDRNHNGIGQADQDPASFDQAFVNATKKVLETRYTLLPYLYTLFYDAHTTGATVVRPLMHEFPLDTATYSIDRQFLWGSGLLITPVLDEGETVVVGYFPDARWYHYESGGEIPRSGEYILLETPLDHINLHVRGGSIIPTQQPAKTTFYSRQNPLGLIVALDEDSKATGKLFWDDGTSINTIEKLNFTILTFTCESSALNITVAKEAVVGLDVSNLFFSTVAIFGVAADSIDSVTVNADSSMEGSGGGANFNMSYVEHTLQLTDMKLYINQPHTISWS